MVDQNHIDGQDGKGPDSEEEHGGPAEPGVDGAPEEQACPENHRQNGLAEADSRGRDALHQELARVVNIALEQERRLESPQPQDGVDRQPGWGEEEHAAAGGHAPVAPQLHAGPLLAPPGEIGRPLSWHFRDAVAVQAQRDEIQQAVEEEGRPAEPVPQQARECRPDSEHPSERHELEERHDAATELLVVSSLRGNEAQRRRDRGGGGAAFEQAREEENRHHRRQARHEDGDRPEDRSDQHDHLAAVAVRQDAEGDSPSQFGCVEAAVQDGDVARPRAGTAGQVVDQEDQHAARDGRANAQHERGHEHGADRAIHWQIA